MRGFIPVCIIIRLIIVKIILDFKEKIFWYALLNLGADGRKGKQKRDKTNYLI
jgi:hypothetical protein